MVASALSDIKKVAGTEFQLLHIRDEKAIDVNGGAFTSGAWRTRDLNTIVSNEIPGVSLSANQITLPAGTYYIEAAAPAFFVGNHRARLRDITNSVTLLTGSSEWNPTTMTSATASPSNVNGKIVLASETTLELQHKCQTTNAVASGLGVRGRQGLFEVYSNIRIFHEIDALRVANIEPANLSTLIRATFENVEIKSLSNSTISFVSGRVGSDDGAVIMEINSPITIDLTALGENGRDAGSETVSTWYYVYAIRNPSTGTIKGLLSTSPTNPALPAGYTQKGLAGLFFNNSSGNIWSYLQVDYDFYYDAIKTALSGGTATTATSVDLSAIVPPEAKAVSVDIFGQRISGTTSSLLNVSSTSGATAFILRAFWSGAGGINNNNDNHGELALFTPQTIWYYHTAPATGASGAIWVSGFKFKR